MSDPEFTPQEQELIERLSNAPHPSLNPAAFEMIRGRMLDAMDNPPLDVNPRMPGRSTPLRLPYLAALAAVLVVGIGMGVLVANLPREIATTTPVVPTGVTIAAPTFTPIVPTQTLQSQVIPSATARPEITNTIPASATVQEVIPSTIPPTDDLPNATATLESVIVVEGPVETITDNIVTIYGIDIALNPDDPLLTLIETGDVLHIEAEYEADLTVIVAVTVTIVDEDVNVNPDTGEVWRDEGNCANPPPPWAPANGWRRRCEGAPGNANPPGQGQGNGQGQGGGNRDGDDDD
jgi:hypothetical protein